MKKLDQARCGATMKLKYAHGSPQLHVGHMHEGRRVGIDIIGIRCSDLLKSAKMWGALDPWQSRCHPGMRGARTSALKTVKHHRAIHLIHTEDCKDALPSLQCRGKLRRK